MRPGPRKWTSNDEWHVRAYIIRRLLLTIPTLVLLTVLVFLSVRFLPGDVIDTMVSESSVYGDAMDRAAFERMLGLDVPVYVQYGRWIGVLPTPDWRTGESSFRGCCGCSAAHCGRPFAGSGSSW